MLFNICIAGWYFRDTNLKNAVVVAHRQGETKHEMHLIPNIGLEWHCYNFYLQNIWKSGDVLFSHDDNWIESINPDYETDTTYIFRDRADELNSMGRHPYGRHGRLIYVKEHIAEKLKREGIWFDRTNAGSTKGASCNDGILAFDKQVNRLGSVGVAYEDVNLGYRGSQKQIQ
jgi:hypothetical protein